MEDERTEPGEMQQVRRADDASQSVQGLRLLQQKRDHSSGLRTTETMRRQIGKDVHAVDVLPNFFKQGERIKKRW